MVVLYVLLACSSGKNSNDCIDCTEQTVEDRSNQRSLVEEKNKQLQEELSVLQQQTPVSNAQLKQDSESIHSKLERIGTAYTEATGFAYRVDVQQEKARLVLEEVWFHKLNSKVHPSQLSRIKEISYYVDESIEVNIIGYAKRDTADNWALCEQRVKGIAQLIQNDNIHSHQIVVSVTEDNPHTSPLAVMKEENKALLQRVDIILSTQ